MNEEEAAQALAAGVDCPPGLIVKMSRQALDSVLRDRPELSARTIVAAIMDPRRVTEHARHDDALIYDARVHTQHGHVRLMVPVDLNSDRNDPRVVTAFVPDDDGYWDRVCGKEVWPNAE